MNIGIFGGTFNPVHKGHVTALEKILQAVSLDRVLVMPDRLPPHKSAENLISGEDRLNMCRLAFGHIDKAEVCDYELSKQGKSYSVLTLRHFHSLYPDDRLYFIMGSDMLLSFDKWYRYEEILSISGLICMSRSAEDTARLEPKAEKLREKGGEIKVVSAEPFEVSSSQIREMLKKNLDCTCYLDENVVQYIKDNNLYRGFEIDG
jgi:nicotinate-nucleotide adenylyltransferase